MITTIDTKTLISTHANYREVSRKHFGKPQQSFTGIDQEKIEAFLSDLLQRTVKIISTEVKTDSQTGIPYTVFQFEEVAAKEEPRFRGQTSKNQPRGLVITQLEETVTYCEYNGYTDLQDIVQNALQQVKEIEA